MTIIYSDTSGGGGAPVAFHSLNAVKGYLRHYENLLLLTFIANTSDRVVEKAQARKELTICERKLKWWENHPNYVQSEALRGVEKLKSDWTKKR